MIRRIDSQIQTQFLIRLSVYLHILLISTHNNIENGFLLVLFKSPIPKLNLDVYGHKDGRSDSIKNAKDIPDAWDFFSLGQKVPKWTASFFKRLSFLLESIETTGWKEVNARIKIQRGFEENLHVLSIVKLFKI